MLTRRVNPNEDAGASLLLVLMLVTVVSVIVASVLSSVDTTVRSTGALRAQGTEFYAADGAAQTAINAIRNSTFTGGSGEVCFPETGSNTLEVRGVNGTDSAAVTCVPATEAAPPVSCPNATGCEAPEVTARITQPGCDVETLWILAADNVVRELRANGTSTGRSVTVPAGDNRDVAISQDGRTMYILVNDGRIHTINLATGRVTRTVDANGPGVPQLGGGTRAANSLSMAPGGKLYLGNSGLNFSYGPAQPVMLVDPTVTRNNTRVIGTLPGAAGGDFVTMPDGTLLASAADGSLYMFRIRADGTLDPAVKVGSVPRRMHEGRSFGPFGLAVVNGIVYAAYADGVGRVSPTPSITNPASRSYSATPMLRTPNNLSHGCPFHGATSAQEVVGCSVPTDVRAGNPEVTGPSPAGVYTARSAVTVTNKTTTAGAYGSLTLTGTSTPAATVTGVSWRRPDGTTGSGTGAGPWTISSGVRDLGGRATDTYEVSITFTKPPTTVTPGGLVTYLDTHLCPDSATCAVTGRPVRRVKVAFVDADPTAPVRGQRQVKIISWSNHRDPAG